MRKSTLLAPLALVTALFTVAGGTTAFPQSREAGPARVSQTAALCLLFDIECNQTAANAAPDSDDELRLARLAAELQVSGSDKHRTLAELEALADNGPASAMFLLGMLYETGRATSQSGTQAVHWYEKAAEQGHALAMIRLGFAYEHGYGVTVDGSAAEYWYRQAADLGAAEAQYALGLLYMRGEAVKADYYEGIYQLERAAEADHARAMDAIGRAYVEGFGVRKNSETALDWFERAARLGLPVAQHNAAVLLENDFYVSEPARAAAWYEKAARAGFGPSMISLGDLYRWGDGVPRNSGAARNWYERALGDADPGIVEIARQRLNTSRRTTTLGTAAFGAGESDVAATALIAAIVGFAVIAAGTGPAQPSSSGQTYSCGPHTFSMGCDPATDVAVAGIFAGVW